MIFPCMSLHYKLVPVQYREYDYGLFITYSRVLKFAQRFRTTKMHAMVNSKQSWCNLENTPQLVSGSTMVQESTEPKAQVPGVTTI